MKGKALHCEGIKLHVGTIGVEMYCGVLDV